MEPRLEGPDDGGVVVKGEFAAGLRVVRSQPGHVELDQALYDADEPGDVSRRRADVVRSHDHRRRISTHTDTVSALPESTQIVHTSAKLNRIRSDSNMHRMISSARMDSGRSGDRYIPHQYPFLREYHFNVSLCK